MPHLCPSEMIYQEIRNFESSPSDRCVRHFSKILPAGGLVVKGSTERPRQSNPRPVGEISVYTNNPIVGVIASYPNNLMFSAAELVANALHYSQAFCK